MATREALDETLRVRVPGAVKAGLEALTSPELRTPSEVARRAIEEYIARNRGPKRKETNVR